jgi:hypothetical protein
MGLAMAMAAAPAMAVGAAMATKFMEWGGQVLVVVAAMAKRRTVFKQLTTNQYGKRLRI